MAFLDVDNLFLSFGGIKALTAVSLSVDEGELFAIIGPNGAGKTCLLNCISGFYQPDKGTLRFEGHDLLGKRPDQIAKLCFPI
jgi:branched-chain amino acid transport system ATP-binding protein